ncbi:hypothetical protein D4R75_13825 [bacterium]|nr:MAG: hypothetical protein D4R75_13825 [bacterium]
MIGKLYVVTQIAGQTKRVTSLQYWRMNREARSYPNKEGFENERTRMEHVERLQIVETQVKMRHIRT